MAQREDGCRSLVERDQNSRVARPVEAGLSFASRSHLTIGRDRPSALEQRGAVSKAGAEGREEQGAAGRDAAITRSLRKCERDGGRAGIPVAGDDVDDLSGFKPKAFAQGG